MLSAACHAGSEYRFVHILLQFSVLISGGSSFLSFRISARIFAFPVTLFPLLLHWIVAPIITLKPYFSRNRSTPSASNSSCVFF